ncbi:MAG: hypothetical protein SFW62_02840 [Alphaproteobacteria bacterium]|nr:hypothetical protein [Alphaproteobacteria bacterium]
MTSLYTHPEVETARDSIYELTQYLIAQGFRKYPEKTGLVKIGVYSENGYEFVLPSWSRTMTVFWETSKSDALTLEYGIGIHSYDVKDPKDKGIDVFKCLCMATHGFRPPADLLRNFQAASQEMLDGGNFGSIPLGATLHHLERELKLQSPTPGRPFVYVNEEGREVVHLFVKNDAPHIEQTSKTSRGVYLLKDYANTTPIFN